MKGRTRKLSVKRDDVVEVISGEDKGRTGKVLRVLHSEGKAVVEGLNVVKRHMRKTQETPQGGILEKEAPLSVSKLRKQVAKAGGKA